MRATNSANGTSILRSTAAFWIKTRKSATSGDAYGGKPTPANLAKFLNSRRSMVVERDSSKSPSKVRDGNPNFEWVERVNLGCGPNGPPGWLNVDGSWNAWLTNHLL